MQKIFFGQQTRVYLFAKFCDDCFLGVLACIFQGVPQQIEDRKKPFLVSFATWSMTRQRSATCFRSVGEALA